MSEPSPSRRENWWFIVLFAVALVAHFLCTTYHWKVPFLVGHEFRQSLTALITDYIDKDNNFSLLYETPMLGKPWVSVLLEVPVYEWSVVGLSRLTGWPHFLAARTISLACFYLMLPAVYLLLGEVTDSRPRRLFVLALVLACPVYIFYSRAFLMESMDLMCCAWFLLGYLRTMERRNGRWLLLAVVAGTSAALIKSATFAIWLLPAAGHTVWLLWRDLRAGAGWRRLLATAAWSLGTVIVALGALRWWIKYTDPIKAAHPSAWIFTSANLAEGNWGLFRFSTILNGEVWRTLMQRWGEAIMPAWVLLALVGAGLALLPRARARLAALAGVFFAAQMLFPYAYAYQDYYFYACAIFLLAGLGVMFLEVVDSTLPRWAVVPLVLMPFALLELTYWRGYREPQSAVSAGSLPFMEAIKDLTPEGSVIVVAGADWAAMVPYYAQRRALMLRNGLEHDHAYLQRAIKDLADEDISALVVQSDTRQNRQFLDWITRQLDMELMPAFSHPMADVYIRRLYLNSTVARLRSSRKYGETTIHETVEEKLPRHTMDISPAAARTAFRFVTPAPFRCAFEHGVDLTDLTGDNVMSAHPDSDLWLRAPAGATSIHWEFGLLPAAWEKSGDKTNGVEFIITGETPDGQRRQVYYRLLDPVGRPGDRTRIRENIPYQPRSGETLCFSTRPNGSPAYDWAYWAKIEVK